MAKHANTVGLPATRDVEWYAATTSLPEYVEGGEGLCRPDLLVFLSKDGALLSTVTGAPGTLVGAAGAYAMEAMRRPATGAPHAPKRILATSCVLACVLRAQLPPSIEVGFARSPDAEALFERRRWDAAARTRERRAYLANGVDRCAVSSLFRASRALYDADPWTKLAAQGSLLSITSEALDVYDYFALLERREGAPPSMVLFADEASRDRYVALAARGTSPAAEPRPTWPQHLALRFVPRAALSPRERAELATHRWELAHPDACPRVELADHDGIFAPPSAQALRVIEAVSAAIGALVAEPAAALEAWRAGAPLDATLAVKTHGGAASVRLRGPEAPDQARAERVRGIVADLAALDASGASGALGASDASASGAAPDLGGATREDREAELMIEFVVSREGRATQDYMAVQRAIDLARDRFGVSIAAIAPAQLRELALEHLPLADAREDVGAGELLAAIRAFFGFLQRAGAIASAAPLLAVLDGDAERRLARRLRGRAWGTVAEAGATA